MAAGKAAGRVLCDPEQSGQGLLPTTMYKDYSINESLFHWQSQSTTAENSATGQRYIHHRAKGKPGAAVRARVQGRCPFWRCRSVYLSGHGELCEARGLPPHEHHMAAGPPDPCKVPQKTNKLVVG